LYHTKSLLFYRDHSYLIEAHVRALIFLFCLAGTIASAMAQSDDIPETDALMKICETAVDQTLCEQSRTQFLDEWPKAWAGDYQSMRNIGFCFKDGCDGSVRINLIAACAWRSALVDSGLPEVEVSDSTNEEIACRSLSRRQRSAAANQAARILKKATHE
jgi:hypothetical protein